VACDGIGSPSPGSRLLLLGTDAMMPAGSTDPG
jgi:hypothetical protein